MAKKKNESAAEVAPTGNPPSAAIDLGMIEISRVEAGEDNLRDGRKLPDIPALAASIAAHGMLNPILVRRTGSGFRVVAGHRRLAAARELGLETVPCREYLPSTELAAIAEPAARIVENDQRLGVDAMLEASSVRDLLAGGLGVEMIARALGRPVGWVKRRAGLAALDPEFLKAKDSILRGWPVAWLEDLASLPHELQVKMRERGELAYLRTRADLQARIFQQTSDLRAAPWDLGDAELVKKAGPCTTCPKRSAVSPGLFDHIDEVHDGDDRCLAAACFAEKFRALRARVVSEAKAKHKDILQIHGAPTNVAAQLRAHGKVLKSWDYTTVKAGAKGALAAVVVDGKSAGTIRYIRRKAKRLPRVTGSAPRVEKPIEGEKLIALQAFARATREVGEIVKGLRQPDDGSLLVLLAAFGLQRLGLDMADRIKGNGDSIENRLRRRPIPAADYLWKHLRETLANVELAGGPSWPAGSKLWAQETQERAEEAELLAGFFDARAPKGAAPFDWKAIVQKALETEQKKAGDGKKK